MIIKSKKITRTNCTEEDDNKCDKHLKWSFDHNWYFFSYLISVIFMIFYIKPLVPSALLLFSFFTLTLVVTIIITKKRESTGSLWCWITAICAPIVVLLNTYLTRNIKRFKILKIL